MDFVYSNLLSIDDLRRVLLERELKIPNIEQLNYDELLKIFNKFVVPFDQRDRRETAAQLKLSVQQAVPTHKRILPPPVSDCAAKLSRVTLNVNAIAQRKRKVEESVDGIPHVASSKRKMITWP